MKVKFKILKEFVVILLIISVLFLFILFISQALENTKTLRYQQRISDINKIGSTLNQIFTNQEQYLNPFSYLSTNTIYLSLQDLFPHCASYLSQLPSLPSGWSYRCSATPTAMNGQGWLPIPFSS
ncbi:MAG: hypothetical protein NZ822_03345, partial [Patescibacteria group bacterium]|nr:hypothetical protein [Patescibacteria group bacterium]